MSDKALPGQDALAQIAAAIGREAAFALAKRLGGTTVYVPRTIGEHHPLRAAIGQSAADKLASWCGGSRLDVPKRLHRHAWVRALARQGTLTIAAIAIETGYSERQVYRLLNDGAAERQADEIDGFDDRQADLFS